MTDHGSSNLFRPYWLRHPIQCRVYCALLLLTLPLWFFPVCMLAMRDEIVSGIRGTVDELRHGMRCPIRGDSWIWRVLRYLALFVAGLPLAYFAYGPHCPLLSWRWLFVTLAIVAWSAVVRWDERLSMKLRLVRSIDAYVDGLNEKARTRRADEHSKASVG